MGEVDADALRVGEWLMSAIECSSHEAVAARLGIARQRVGQWALGCLPPMRALPTLLKMPGVGRELARIIGEYAHAAPAPGLDARDDLALVMGALGPVGPKLVEFLRDGVIDDEERGELRGLLLKVRDRVDGMLRDLEVAK